MGRGSVVSIATRCGLDCPGIEFQAGVRFSASVQTGPVPHPPPSSTEVKERLELYIPSPLGLYGLSRDLTSTFLLNIWCMVYKNLCFMNLTYALQKCHNSW